MKFVFVAISFISFGLSAFAQKNDDEEKDHKFKRENIFIGGGVGLGLGGGGFSASLSPEVGYSIAEWLDAGVATNFNYFNLSPEWNGGYRDRIFTYGVGIFTRLYPIRGIFLQAMPEYNWIKASSKYVGSETEFKSSAEAPSLLLGIGYSTREIGSSNFYTVIMFDTGNNTESPYIGGLGSKMPVLRTGFNFYLRPKTQSSLPKF